LNQTRSTRQNRIPVLLTAAAVLAMLAGCATEAPKPEPVQPQPVAQAPVTPPPAPAPAPAPAPVQPKAIAQPDARSVYFDFDKSEIKDESIATVRANADYLVQSGDRIVLEGNADERGSRDYNMALGQKRADAVKKALTAIGVKADKIDTISNGEDKPKAKGHDEASWSENRRVDVIKK